MRFVTLKCLTLAIACIATIFHTPAPANAAEEWDLPTAYSAGNFHTEMVVRFAEKVGAYTEGAVVITVHPGGSLFGGGDIKRAVQTAQTPIGERFMSAHANEAPILGWDNLPFLATNYNDNAKLWGLAQGAVNRQMEALNMVTLYTCPWPGQGFYFQKPIASAADTEGLKFRAYNSATANIAESLGMLPVQIELAELNQALATGVAEALISSASSGYDQKLWEHMTHFYTVNAWLPRNYVMVNKGVWDGLDAEVQGAIRQAAGETAQDCAARSEELSNWYLEQLTANGMTVTDAPPEFLAELQAIGAMMQGAWADTVGSDGQAILDAYRAE